MASYIGSCKGFYVESHMVFFNRVLVEHERGNSPVVPFVHSVGK